jgi:hypothetical protein
MRSSGPRGTGSTPTPTGSSRPSPTTIPAAPRDGRRGGRPGPRPRPRRRVPEPGAEPTSARNRSLAASIHRTGDCTLELQPAQEPKISGLVIQTVRPRAYRLARREVAFYAAKPTKSRGQPRRNRPRRASSPPQGRQAPSTWVLWVISGIGVGCGAGRTPGPSARSRPPHGRPAPRRSRSAPGPAHPPGPGPSRSRSPSSVGLAPAMASTDAAKPCGVPIRGGGHQAIQGGNSSLMPPRTPLVMAPHSQDRSTPVTGST